jgi:hypothetical protein
VDTFGQLLDDAEDMEAYPFGASTSNLLRNIFGGQGQVQGQQAQAQEPPQ